MRCLSYAAAVVCPNALSAGLAVVVALSMNACGPSDPATAGVDAGDAEAASRRAEEAELVAPSLAFINLQPWGEVDFTRGEFPSLDDCNAFVRALPSYSGYTTAERCQPIDGPVYCTAWQEDESDHLDCFVGVGGCEVELKRHDLLAESGARTIARRCEPSALEEAWARYQTAVKTPE